MSVLTVGHLCVDLTPGLGDTVPHAPGRLFAIGPMRARLGGSVANTGRALRTLGVPVRAEADVGDDALGALTRELLAGEGIDAVGVRARPGATTSYSVVLEPRGADRTFWHHSGANDLFTGDDVDPGDARVLHLGYPPLMAALRADGGAAIVRLFRRARAAGVATSLDLAVVDPDSSAAEVDWTALLDAVLPLTDLVTPSRDDLVSAWGDDVDAAVLAERCVAAGAAIALVTDGERGMRMATGSAGRLAASGAAVASLGADWADARLAVDPLPLDRIETTNGAGDAASAGLIAAVLARVSPEAALAAAARAAAEAVSGRTRQETA